MILKDLLEVLDADQEVDFEIIESTWPETIRAQAILVKYPYATDYEVEQLIPSVSVTGYGRYSPSLLIVVSRGDKLDD